MNDDELSLRLRGELHRRIDPPDFAPEALHEHLRRLRTMEVVRPARRRPSRGIGTLARLAAVVAVCVLAGAGLAIRGSVPNTPAKPGPTFNAWAMPSAINISVHTDVIDGGGRLDDRVGWVEIARPGSSRYVRITRDGGATWSNAREIGGSSLDVDFLDADYGWMVSQSSTPTALFHGIVVSSTRDGGTTWHDVEVEMPQPNDDQLVFATVHFRDRAHGVVLDVRQALTGGRTCEKYTSEDGGLTWTGPLAAPCAGFVTFLSPMLGYGQLQDAQAHTVGMAFTKDGGQTWTSVDGAPDCPDIYTMAPSTDGSVREVCGRGGSNGLADHPDLRLMSTADGGRTWVTLGPPQGLGADFAGISVARDDLWIMANTSVSKYFVSSDGGLTWRQVPAAGLPSGVLDVRVLPGGWVAVDSGVCGPDTEAANGVISAGSCVPTSSSLFELSVDAESWTKLLTAPRADPTP